MTRDMSDMEFKQAMKRRGWSFTMGWVDIGDGHHIGCVMTKKRGGWQLHKRATLANAIKEHEAYAASAGRIGT